MPVKHEKINGLNLVFIFTKKKKYVSLQPPEQDCNDPKDPEQNDGHPKLPQNAFLSIFHLILAFREIEGLWGAVANHYLPNRKIDPTSYIGSTCLTKALTASKYSDRPRAKISLWLAPGILSKFFVVAGDAS